MQHVLCILVICGAICPTPAFRESIADEETLQEGGSSGPCTYTAEESEDEVRSLTMRPVPFDFFQSREFFVADDCVNPRLKPKLRSVPKSSEGRRAILEQRFKVKMLKEGVHGALHQNAGYLKKVKTLMDKKDVEYLPAVELHMFPLNPMNATAEWQVLLVPTAPEVFGKKLRLCHKPDGQAARCIAKLPFPRLPRHLQAWIGLFDPVDRLRSTPMQVIRLAEGSLLFGLALLVAVGVYLVRIWCCQTSEQCTFSEPELPATYLLATHAKLYPEAGGREAPISVLDSGSEVVVDKITPTTRYIPYLSMPQEWKELCRRAFSGPSKACWGHVKQPAGWILLYEDNGETKVLANAPIEACLKGHPDLVPGLVDMIKKNLVLAGAYVSAQWVALARLTDVYRPDSFACLVCGMCLVHLVVLLQQAFSFQSGLEHEEQLDQKKLLRLSPRYQLSAVFGATVLLMTMLLLSGVPAAWSETSHLSGIALSLASLGLHAKHLYDALASHQKWREPQVKSKEHLILTMSPLEATEDTPPDLAHERAQKWLAAKAVKATFAWLAVSVLAAILLDVVQLRGQLLKYDVNRGHLTSPGGSEAFHNTLLLDTNADSLMLNVELFDHTQNLTLKIEHPLLNDSEEIAFNASGEHQMDIPAGPLYSRILLRAVGSYRSTTYAIHVIRVAPAITVSLNSSFDGSDYPNLADVRFVERRRLRYLLDHTTWYVPDLDMSSNSTIKVLMDYLVLAPLVPSTNRPGLPMMSSKQCRDICGHTTAGFGNDCIYEEDVDLPERLCIGLNVPQTLNLEKSDLSVAGRGSTLLDWIQDVHMSGKFVRINDFKQERGPVHLPFQPAAAGLCSSFVLETQLSTLAGRVELDMAVTQDPTSAEGLTMPLVIVSHPPLPQLEHDGPKSDCFFLPEMMRDTPRTEYALCDIVDIPGEVVNVSVTVDDPRFRVLRHESHEAKKCTGHGYDQRTEFRAVRVEDCPWCHHYIPWDAAGYDLVVRRSTLLCLKTAVDLEKVHALESILAPTRHRGDKHNTSKCVDEAGLLGDAIRKTKDTKMIQVMLNMGADPAAESRGQTPLQIAAVRGYLDAMGMLLNSSAPTDGSLAAAASRCQVEAMELLVSRGKSEATRCQDSQAFDAFENQPWFSCRARPVLRNVLDLLEKGTKYVMDNQSIAKCKGGLLNTAIHHKDAEAVRLLLEAGADANLKAVRTPLGQLMSERCQKKPPISLADFKKLAELLKVRGMNISSDDVLYSAASLCKCDLDLVKLLLQLGADPANPDAIEEADYECGKKEAEDFKKVLADAQEQK